MMESNNPTLLALILVPLLAAAGVIVAPVQRAKGIALAGTMVALVLAAFALAQFDWGYGNQFQFAWAAWWLPTLGLKLSVGTDAVAILLIALTALLGPICVLASSTAITERLKTYYAWLLVLQAAMTGVFAARDLVLFYICFEFTLVPMFVLISLYGSTNRRKAAIKFFLYTFTGSLVALAGLVYVVWHHFVAKGQWTFDIGALEQTARAMPASAQGWVLLALMAGFAVKVPLFPLHTWLPLAHTEAPTAGSVILAGVLLKLGTYGIYRFALPFAPLAVIHYAPLIAVLSIIGILYAGLICWVQRDVKRLVAYSSVAHLGFCILGLVALNGTGITGSVLYMINHGLSTGALFLCVGMIYERYHTRSMDEINGLAARMPIWATFMVFFTLASVGLPGLNGFVSEFLCLLGTFQAGPIWGADPGHPLAGQTPGQLGSWYALVAGLGMIVAAMYLLYMLGRVVWGPLKEPHAHEDGQGRHPVLPADLNAREITVLAPLAIACLVLGVYPQPLLDVLRAPSIGLAASVWKAAEQDRLKQQAPDTEAGAAIPVPRGDATRNGEPAGAAGMVGTGETP
jgi:NADH-quinone oxidoreductase subunit M